jgi:outer membrane protein assembly factor BamA
MRRKQQLRRRCATHATAFSSATFASKACSASPKARSSTTCRSTSATRWIRGASREAVKSLYQTGFFRDVELRRDGTVLVVAVVERPTIESFEVKGNKDIKTEDLEKSLRTVGLASGKSFDQSVLDEVKRYLTEQYFSRGKYSVLVDAKAEEVPGNKVKVAIDIHEGQRARIQQINVVGNSSFFRGRAARPVATAHAELVVVVPPG